MRANEKLKRMAEMAHARFNAGPYHFTLRNGSHRYVRVTGNGYLAVSLDDSSPCKSLVDESGHEVKVEMELAKALAHAGNLKMAGRTPETNQEEHRIQAFIIREHLLGKLQSATLGLHEKVDRLQFVTDELAINEIRADLIFLGIKNGRYFPVFIELKIDRLATKLRDQLDDITKYSQQYSEEFSMLLKSATGISGSNVQISMDKPLRVAIWPESDSGKERVGNALQTGDIAVITYRELDGGKFDFQYRSYKP